MTDLFALAKDIWAARLSALPRSERDAVIAMLRAAADAADDHDMPRTATEVQRYIRTEPPNYPTPRMKPPKLGA